MTDGASIAPSISPLRAAVREGIALTAVSLALALFYNGVTGKGVFGEPKPAGTSSSTNAAPEIIPVDMAMRLHADGVATFVDSRHDFDFRLGHIPGALNLPLSGSDETIARLTIPKDRTVVVYCDGAECNSSLEVAAKLSAAGYSKVYVFFAGWTAWKNAGQPVVEEGR